MNLRWIAGEVAIDSAPATSPSPRAPASALYARRSIGRFLLVLLALSAPLWLIGSLHRVELFPGFELFQLGLGMPSVAAFFLVYREEGRAGVVALLRRTYDVRRLRPRIWLLPILLIYPSMGLLDYAIQRLAGRSIPAPQFSIILLLGYSSVFLLTFGEELGLTGYATDPMLERHGALASGLFLGLIWAGYHLPGFVISGYYTPEWIAWHVLYVIAGRVLFVWVYQNAGKSLFSMALMHATFGVFWVLWPPTENLQRATPAYDPRVAALVAITCVAIVAFLWGPQTLARFRFRTPSK